jgi:hypothetical protein
MRAMKAVVVYESIFGNSREIAEAVAEGLSEHLEVELHEATVVPTPSSIGQDLIVVGGPKHAYALSRPRTLREAVKHVAHFRSRLHGLREWLSQLPCSSESPMFAAFETKVASVRHLPGSAAKKATRMLQALGYAVIGRECFYVADPTGPLFDGEADRARQWGFDLGARAAASVRARELNVRS